MTNRKRNYTLFYFTFAALLLAALGAANYLGMNTRHRFDLTVERRHTLSQGTRDVLDTLKEPVSVTYYVSAELPPRRVNLERDVVEKLTELAEASEGKLMFDVVRITNAELASKKTELEKLGVEIFSDVQTTGSESTRQRVIGVQGFFSSLLVRHGVNKPIAVNGVVNVAVKDDERREHRVDTIEFDVMYSVLKLKNTQKQTPLKELLPASRTPLSVGFIHSEQMPRENPLLATNVGKAIERIKKLGGSLVDVQTQQVPWGQQLVYRDPETGRSMMLPFIETDQPTVDPKDYPQGAPPAPGPGGDREGDGVADEPVQRADPPDFGSGGDTPQPATPKRQGPNYYYCIVQLQWGTKSATIADWRIEKSEGDCFKRIEDLAWEMVKPRNVLGVLEPPADAGSMDMMRGQQSPYDPLLRYIGSPEPQGLGYTVNRINLAQNPRIPRDLACLLVFEVNRLSERELYEIDRYLCEGGNVVLLYQGWTAEMKLMSLETAGVPLRRVPVEDHFTRWAAHHGFSFGAEPDDPAFGKGAYPYPLVQRGGYNLMPFVESFGSRGQRAEPVGMGLPLAVRVNPEDIGGDTAYGRGLSGMMMPLAVEIGIADELLAQRKIGRRDVLKLKGDVYRLRPDLPTNTSLSRQLTFESATRQSDERKPKLVKLENEPVVATLLTGQFDSFWAGKGKKVPMIKEAQPGVSDIGGQNVPDLRAAPGRLLVVGCSQSLAASWFQTIPGDDEVWRSIVNGSLALYKNAVEVSAYGDELVSLRTRSGLPPRISKDPEQEVGVGSLSISRRTLWIVICLAGAPVLLLGLALVRSAAEAASREAFRKRLQNEGVLAAD